MTTIKVDLDGEAIKEATVQAIAGILTPEKKEELIRAALNTILTPSTNRFESGKSPIQLAFESAANKIAHEQCQKMIDGDSAVRAKLQELLEATAKRILAVDVEEMSKRMADAFVDSMRQKY